MRKVLEQRMKQMSADELYNEIYCDHLSRTLNRRAFELSSFSSVAIVDLDSLKYVNDVQGYRAGDQLISRFAECLMEVFGNDAVFRLGGDEFAITSEDILELYGRLEKLQKEIAIFSFGVSNDLARADARLKLNKTHREVTGRRAPRGGAPIWSKEHEEVDTAGRKTAQRSRA